MAFMKLLIVTIVIFAALAVIIDVIIKGRRKQASLQNETKDDRLLSADEAEPTETGRYRVQQMLNKAATTNSEPGATSVRTTSTTEPSSEPLPDPFGADTTAKKDH